MNDDKFGLRTVKTITKSHEITLTQQLSFLVRVDSWIDRFVEKLAKKQEIADLLHGGFHRKEVTENIDQPIFTD